VRSSYLGAAFAATLSLSALPALAATQAELAHAEQLLAAKKPLDALRLLEKAYDPAAAGPQEYFLLGVAAKQSGKLQKAEGYLLKARELEPDAGRIRLELAEVQYGLGKYDASRAELIAVRAMNPPPQVRQNIDGFIAQVDATKADPSRAPKPKKNWSAYITTGIMSDSNVNGGPDTGTVFLYGLPFTLSEDAQETRDEAWFLRAGISHSAPISDRMAWSTSANLAFQDHFTADAYDTLTLSIATGPSIKLSERFSLALPLEYSVQSYTDQGGWYSQTIGFGPRLQFAAQKNLQFYLDTSISRKTFNDNPTRDLTAWELSPSLNYQPSPNGNIAFGLQFGAENAGSDVYSNEVRGGYIGYQHSFKDVGVKASVTFSYTDTQFEGIQAAYGVARHDISKRISANISYAVPQWQGAELNGALSFQDNTSNIDMNDYTRTQFSLSLTKRF